MGIMKKYLSIILVLSLCLILSVLSSCQSQKTEVDQRIKARTVTKESAIEKTGTRKIKIVTTIGMINDLVKQVVKDKHEVQNIIDAGVDPHLYKATRSDIALLSSADLVFYNGLLLEGKLTDALIRVASSGRKVVAVTESIDKKYLLSPPEFNEHYDPHVWMDPAAWLKTVEVITDKVISLDNVNKDFYRKNSQDLINKLKKLDSYCQEALNTVPNETRVLVTAHDAFNYFGKRYGYEVLGIQGISTESEAGVKDIQDLVKTLVDRKIKAVFVESTVSDRNIKALVEGAKSYGHEVSIGGKLFSDAMGKSGTYRGTYVGMIDHNVTTIVKALGGSAPTSGLNGSL